MSDADENKLDDFSFDVNVPVSADEANGAFDFDLPTEEAPVPSAADSVETPSVGEPELPVLPSGFLTESTEEPESAEPAEAVPVIETTGKKGRKKPEKKKKEKKAKPVRESGPREPMDIGSVLSLCFGVLALLGLIAVNALIFTAPAAPGIGGSSTMYYAVGINVFGLVFVAVPFLFWKFHKGKEREQDLQLFDVMLGLALMAFVIGVLCLLTAIYRYDFTIKAAKTPTSLPRLIAHITLETQKTARAY